MGVEAGDKRFFESSSRASYATVEQTRIDQIDGLRFAASLSVMLFHYAMEYRDLEWLRPVARFGFLGVELFFMISGFVIAYTAFNKTAYQFLVARASRLYPTFWICVGLAVVLLSYAGMHYSWQTILANLSMVPSVFGQPLIDDVYWTLFGELKFYGLVFLLIVCRQIERFEFWLLVWLMLSCVHLAFSDAVLDSMVIAGYSPFFIAGCVLYFLRTRGISFVRMITLLGAAALGIVQVLAVQQGFTHDATANMPACVLLIALYCVFFAAAVGGLQVPRHRIWLWLGAMTYPLYLVHAASGQTLRSLLPAQWPEGARTAAAMAFSLSAAVVLAYAVEMKLCRKLNRTILGLPRTISLK